MPNLQEDKLDAMRNILLVISKQMHNASTPSYVPSDFKPLNWALRVNRCFYISLGCTLSSALISVLALQWIRDYDMSLSGMERPRTRALYRQFRFEGLQRWFLPQIISMLPVLLHIALILFFVALIDWLTHTDGTVAITMILVATIVVVFYVITQLAAAISPSAPFRTPVSRLIERVGEIIGAIFNPKVKVNTVYATLKSRQFSREDQAITTDNTLPSSALIWLLNRNNQRQWSTGAIVDIIGHLTREGNASMVRQNFLRDKGQWTIILDRVFLSLYQQRRVDKTYDSDIEQRFTVTLEASLIVGGEALGSVAQSILLSGPFTQFNFQSTPLGLLCRLALWRSGKPYPNDSNGPPIDLYRKISQTCVKYSPILVLICLQEIQMALTEKKISREITLNCLTNVLLTPDNETGVFGILSDRDLSSLLLSLGLMTFDDSTSSSQNLSDSSVEMLMLMILNRYHEHRQPNVTWSNDHIRFIRALLQQFLLGLATSPPGKQTLLQLEIFRHPSLSSLWMNELESPGLRLKSAFMKQLWQPTEALYPSTNSSFPRWALELCQAATLMISSLPTPLTPAPSEKDWDIMITALSTVVVCISNSQTRDNGSLTLPVENSGQWLTELATGLMPAMRYSTIAFVISAMLSGHVRYRFGKIFHGKIEEEYQNTLMTIENAELRIASYMLAGCECWKSMPSPEDSAFNSSALKVLVKNWRGFQPVIFLTSDEHLVRSLCRIGHVEWVNEAFEFLWTRMRQLVGTNRFIIPAKSHL
jgi:hypothetical protein